MKPVNPLWFKVLAVGTAVGLGGGYVWKRQQSAAAPPPPPLEVKAAEGQELPKADSEVMLMPSSKTIILDTPISPQPMIRDPKTLMTSSKSGAVILDESPTAEQRKLLLSGSKSGILIEPEPEPQPQPQQQKKP